MSRQILTAAAVFLGSLGFVVLFAPEGMGRLLVALELLQEAHTPAGWALGGLFVVHALAFAWILFRARPWAEGAGEEGGGGAGPTC